VFAAASAAMAAAVPADVVLVAAGGISAGAGAGCAAGSVYLVSCWMPEMALSSDLSGSVRLSRLNEESTYALIALSTFWSSPGSFLASR
jgi:hypothetical protein